MSSMLDLLEIRKQPVPKKKTSPPKSRNVAAAALAVAEALRGHTGRAKAVDQWKPIAAQVLGFKKLHSKRWHAVLSHGLRNQLFEIDESGKYPVLVLIPPPPMSSDMDSGEKDAPDIASSEDELASLDSEKELITDTEPNEVDTELSIDSTPRNEFSWKPPYIHDCGHMSVTNNEEEFKAAQEAGQCCTNPRGKVHWQYLKGKYIRPIPRRLRRTKDKGGGMGYPGLCCNAEGFYQGGIANCHIYQNPKGIPCEGCNLRPRKKDTT